MDLQVARTRRYRARKLEWIRDVKSQPCMDCGGTFPPECMDFDHRPGEVKSFHVSDKGRAFSPARVLAEIAKCDLVCANCHRIRTEKRRRGVA